VPGAPAETGRQGHRQRHSTAAPNAAQLAQRTALAKVKQSGWSPPLPGRQPLTHPLTDAVGHRRRPPVSLMPAARARICARVERAALDVSTARFSSSASAAATTPLISPMRI
jgi:hypothetical protein